MLPMHVVSGTTVTVSATASSVGGSIDCAAVSANAVYVVNTSTTLNVAVRIGAGAQTAVLTTDIRLAPMQSVLIGANPQVTNVAAIGSAAGPTAVAFTPVRTL